jgi:peptidoglycan/xylan/chitin deacetylase (PgdA/CDA1 family)
VGASTKRYEVYSTRSWGLGRLRISGNWLFLKYLPGVKRWAPYRELTAAEWGAVLTVLCDAHASMTVAVTAAWAERSDRVIPFPQRFPEAAAVLKQGVQQGLIEIANHGLTHCVLKDNLFRPRWFSSNRTYHREFWPWVPSSIQEFHIRRAQEILEDYFKVPVVTFVPPGNVFTEETLAIAERYGLRYVSCATRPSRFGRMTIVGNDAIVPFHDRDVVMNGVGWLERLLARDRDTRFCSIAQLVANRA